MALVMSLIILLILTLLGITAMSTSSLEEKMSGNTQEGTKAFEVAESGLQSTLSDGSQFNVDNPVTTPYPINGRTAQVITGYLQDTDPPRGLGFSNDHRAYHFQQTSQVNPQIDSANVGLNTTITRGIAQIK
jgi:DNA-binding beta-propeller fold protein YncE